MKDRTDNIGRVLGALVCIAALACFAVVAPRALAAPPVGDTIRRAEVFNTAVLANTDILAANLTQDARASSSAFRVTIAIKTTDSIVNLRVSQGVTEDGFDFNDGTALVAGRLYTFVFGASRTFGFNFQAETGCTIGYLCVEEIISGSL